MGEGELLLKRGSAPQVARGKEKVPRDAQLQLESGGDRKKPALIRCYGEQKATSKKQRQKSDATGGGKKRQKKVRKVSCRHVSKDHIWTVDRNPAKRDIINIGKKGNWEELRPDPEQRGAGRTVRAGCAVEKSASGGKTAKARQTL